MAELNLKKVSKSFGPVEVLKRVDLQVNNGEFMVFVGPSGCGKSTLLRIIAGLEEMNSGDIFLDGASINNKQPVERGMAMVFQSYALYPHMTVAENMGFGLKIAHRPKDEIKERVRQAAEILQMENLLHRTPKELSGGQRQRVAIGRAIVRNPTVFLFDEPLSNLDAKMRVEMRKEILQLHKRLRSTMIYVTHDQVEAMTLGDRICVLRDGVVQQIGKPGDIFDDPCNTFVAGFIGTPPMNLIPGTLTAVGDGIVFQAGKLSLAVPKELAARVSAHCEKQVLLGLRPKSLSLVDTLPEEERFALWEAEVDVAEMLGEETLVHVTCDSFRLVANVDPHALNSGTGKIVLCPNINRAHFFDAETGENLTMSVTLPGRRTVRRFSNSRSEA